MNLEVQLEARNAFACATDFEIHVTEVVFCTDNVG